MSNPPLQWSIDAHSVHAALSLSYEANAGELEALKRYAEVEDVKSFRAQVQVWPLSGGKFKATGSLEAEAVQASVVDLSPVPATIDETFSVEFWPQNSHRREERRRHFRRERAARASCRRADRDRRVPLRTSLRLARSLSTKCGRYVFLGSAREGAACNALHGTGQTAAKKAGWRMRGRRFIGRNLFRCHKTLIQYVLCSVGAASGRAP